MLHTLENGKTVNIPNIEIEKYKKKLGLSQDDAIHLWLTDNDYEIDEEQNEIDEKAKKVKIQHDATFKTTEKDKKPRVVKVSDEKTQLFNVVLDGLNAVYGENVQILNENKLIQVKIDDKTFKIDIIEQRKPKK